LNSFSLILTKVKMKELLIINLEDTMQFTLAKF